MKRIYSFSFLLIIFIAISTIETDIKPDSSSDPQAHEVAEAGNSSEYYLTDEGKNTDNDSSKPYMMTVVSSYGNITKTSTGTAGSYTDIHTCHKWNGGSGTFNWEMYEVPSSGSDILKASGYHSTSWVGCETIIFSVSSTSKVKVVVYGNTGINSVFEVDNV